MRKGYRRNSAALFAAYLRERSASDPSFANFAGGALAQYDPELAARQAGVYDQGNVDRMGRNFNAQRAMQGEADRYQSMANQQDVVNGRRQFLAQGGVKESFRPGYAHNNVDTSKGQMMRKAGRMLNSPYAKAAAIGAGGLALGAGAVGAYNALRPEDEGM